MKLTCLSQGSSFHSPPSHLLTISGFSFLIDSPIDFSALSIFSPIPSPLSNQYPDADSPDSPETSPNSTASGQRKRRRMGTSFDAADLICAAPWYKTAGYLHFWDVSSIDVVLISSPMGMLGLPFLTRDHKFSAKIYATESAVRLGRLMMQDLVSMQDELSQFYGPMELACPQWMKSDELELLPLALRKIAMGDGGSELGNWQPLYSAADVNDCIQKVQTLKYAEEACYNGTLVIKAFSSGLEIGTSNWTINGPRRNVTYLSSSIFQSAHAMGFDFQSLQGNDIVIFSDFSSLYSKTIFCNDNDGNMKNMTLEEEASSFSAHRENYNYSEECMKSLAITDESSEEMEKISFICSCVVNAAREGGSVLIPIGRLGIVLQLLEQISLSLQSLNLKVPIFIISTTAEETLAFTNIIPEWLCKERQEKLYSGEALFGHVELIKGKRIHVFPAIHSSNLLTTWQEPCIVFSPHWSLRLGPVVHLLRRWCGDQNCLLILEQGFDPDVALLPYAPVAMKVLQCSFLTGIKMQKVQPLLEILSPKVILFPEELRMQLHTTNTNSTQFLYYSVNDTLRVPSLRDDYEADLATDLAFQLQPRRTRQENIAVARLKGELVVSHGRHLLVSAKETSGLSQPQLLHWGTVDPNLLVLALQEKSINGSLDSDGGGTDGACFVRVEEPSKALIEIGTTRTVICTSDETLAAYIFDAVSSVLDGI
ncbi:uncharacterized protein LOC131250767 [Magnolia sinica]|uniref:uncharacterized protein LOC131250767 n=1 Tax=Magnolia sinica TaxID=86752 RepID=UPI002657E88F|nr:uncharacterized protein LOC131250767 [Magnolia sinica]